MKCGMNIGEEETMNEKKRILVYYKRPEDTWRELTRYPKEDMCCHRCRSTLVEYFPTLGEYACGGCHKGVTNRMRKTLGLT
jgi:hypothetical protein